MCAAVSEVCVEIDESAGPVPAPVVAACDLLGLDPLHVANEGCLVAFVAPVSGRTIIGEVTHGAAGRVLARTLVGSSRVVDVLIGEQLPRIC